MKRSVLLPVSLILSVFLFSCSQKNEKEKIITVTIEPQRYFAQQLAGNLFEVVTMVPPGTNPETYDPSPVQMTQLARSAAYFRIGKIGFEEVWMDKIQANNPGLRIFDNGENIQYVISAVEHDHGDQDHGEHDHGSHDQEHAHAGGIDPHTWSSPPEAMIIAENMCNALIDLDKKNETIYRSNLAVLQNEINQTDSIVKSLLAHATHKAFLIYHPALTYLARDYGLTQHCIEIDGKEPSPEQMKNLVEMSRSEGVKIIFIQQEFDQKNAEVIAKETGCKLVVINPLSYNWSEETIKIAKALSDE